MGRYDEAASLARHPMDQHPLAVPHDALALAFARLELGRALLSLERFSEAEPELIAAERQLSRTDHFHVGLTALIALYSRWDEASPDRGHDAKAQLWTRKIVRTFVRLEAPPTNADYAQPPRPN
jgi:hypothetical protein